MKYSKRTLQAHEETRWIGMTHYNIKFWKLLPAICLCGARTGGNYIMGGFQNLYYSYYCIKNQDVE